MLAIATPATLLPAGRRLGVCKCDRCQDRGHDHTDADDFADHDPSMRAARAACNLAAKATIFKFKRDQ
jgi:hypothetical protein